MFHSGIKYTTVEDVESCILMQDGKEFCYDYNKFDCDFDETLGECKNSSTYTIQKKNEALSRNGNYMVQGSSTSSFEMVFVDGTTADTMKAYVNLGVGNLPVLGDNVMMKIAPIENNSRAECYFMGKNNILYYDTFDAETRVTCKTNE